MENKMIKPLQSALETQTKITNQTYVDIYNKQKLLALLNESYDTKDQQIAHLIRLVAKKVCVKTNSNETDPNIVFKKAEAYYSDMRNERVAIDINEFNMMKDLLLSIQSTYKQIMKYIGNLRRLTNNDFDILATANKSTDEELFKTCWFYCQKLHDGYYMTTLSIYYEETIRWLRCIKAASTLVYPTRADIYDEYDKHYIYDTLEHLEHIYDIIEIDSNEILDYIKAVLNNEYWYVLDKIIKTTRKTDDDILRCLETLFAGWSNYENACEVLSLPNKKLNIKDDKIRSIGWSLETRDKKKPIQDEYFTKIRELLNSLWINKNNSDLDACFNRMLYYRKNKEELIENKRNEHTYIRFENGKSRMERRAIDNIKKNYGLYKGEIISLNGNEWEIIKFSTVNDKKIATLKKEDKIINIDLRNELINETTKIYLNNWN